MRFHERGLRRQAIMSLGVLVGLLLFGPSALAKGPAQALIEGPGLASPLALNDPGEPTIGPVLAKMVQASGFLPGLFGAEDMRARSPHGELGPRYTVKYTLGGPGRPTTVTQYVFPFATAGPVTYMPPDQPFWQRDATGGGWYVADRELSGLLVDLGVPRPSAAGPDRSPDVGSRHTVPGVLAFGVVLAALTAGSVVLRLRRERIEQRTQRRSGSPTDGAPSVT